MRTRSESAETVGLRVTVPPDQNGRPAGGKRFKLPWLWGGQKTQPPVIINTVIDSQHSPKEKEPKVVSPPFEEILRAEDVQHLCGASQQMIQREECLFGDLMETDSLTQQFEEVDKLAADYENLKGLILRTLRLSLSPGEVNEEALMSAVKAVHQEVAQDQLWKKRDRSSPPWRRADWKELHDSTLCSLVEDRLDNPSTPPPEQLGKSSFQRDVNSMGRQLKEDLLTVVSVVKRCYPPEQDICNFYAMLYHQNFSSRLRKIADFGLDDRDCILLLLWTNKYYPEILQKPELVADINSAAMGKLLSQDLLEPLEEQYLSKQQEELKTFISRVLEEADQKWKKGEEPAREDGCYVSEVAYDIIQLINGMVSSAGMIVGDQQKAQTITCQLTDLMQSFKSFHNTIMKQNKANSQPFIKANLGSIKQFMDVLHKERHLFQEDVQRNCLQVLTDMKDSAHMYLLKPVHEGLRPKYSKLGTSEWLSQPAVFENLMDGVEEELQDLQGAVQSCQQELVGQLHQEVTVEYLRRLLKGKVKLKDKEQQHKAYLTITSNTEKLQDLFGKMGSKEEWLREILIKVAEVLKLQELPSIQVEVVSLGTAFPDLSEKHVSALLKLKTNISKAKRGIVKKTLTESLKDINAVADRQFFSKVQVK